MSIGHFYYDRASCILDPNTTEIFAGGNKYPITTTMQFDPSATQLPVRKDLLPIKGAPAGAAWFWGKNDEVSPLKFVGLH